MRAFRFALPIILLSLGAVGLAETTAAPPAAVSDAQKSFALLKSLAGTWQGPVVTDSETMKTDKPLFITIRPVSQGTTLLHEMREAVMPEATAFYVEGDALKLMHYCDYQNRVLMTARPSPDGKTIEFDFTEMTGKDAPGHVTHGVFTIIDANHHTEAWIFQIPGQKPIHAVSDLRRVP